MKQNIFLILFLAIAVTSFAQTEDGYKNKPLEVAEVMPAWNGCDFIDEVEKMNCTYNKIMNYLVKKIKYPKYSRKHKHSGTVYVFFVVNSEGTVEGVKVTRSVTPELDAESIRVVKSMPQWSPGVQDGKRVSVCFNLPIKYTL